MGRKVGPEEWVGMEDGKEWKMGRNGGWEEGTMRRKYGRKEGRKEEGEGWEEREDEKEGRMGRKKGGGW